jgi:hypothetical protein
MHSSKWLIKRFEDTPHLMKKFSIMLGFSQMLIFFFFSVVAKLKCRVSGMDFNNTIDRMVRLKQQRPTRSKNMCSFLVSFKLDNKQHILYILAA